MGLAMILTLAFSGNDVIDLLEAEQVTTKNLKLSYSWDDMLEVQAFCVVIDPKQTFMVDVRIVPEKHSDIHACKPQHPAGNTSYAISFRVFYCFNLSLCILFHLVLNVVSFLQKRRTQSIVMLLVLSQTSHTVCCPSGSQ